MAPHNRFNHRWGKGTKTGWLQLLVDKQAMRRLSGPSRQQTDEQAQGSRTIPSELTILSDVSNSYHFDSSSPGATKGDPTEVIQAPPPCVSVAWQSPNTIWGDITRGYTNSFSP